jgi:hypothetical protein
MNQDNINPIYCTDVLQNGPELIKWSLRTDRHELLLIAYGILKPPCGVAGGNEQHNVQVTLSPREIFSAPLIQCAKEPGTHFIVP